MANDAVAWIGAITGVLGLGLGVWNAWQKVRERRPTIVVDFHVPNPQVAVFRVVNRSPFPIELDSASVHFGDGSSVDLLTHHALTAKVIGSRSRLDLPPGMGSAIRMARSA